MAVDVVAIDVPGGDPGRMLQHEPDEALAALVRQGHESAFVAIYDRHHRGLIAFCRHMLASKEEAEDALQHTFFAAYHALTGGGTVPRAFRPWLYTIARNRCLTVLRARRPHESADEETDGGAVVIGLAEEVQRRSDLRDLVADLHRLPEEQKAALVLFEMGDLSHAEIAEALGVPRDKVKALVYQAREGLLRARTARDTPCAEIRHEVAARRRPLPQRGVVRGHLDRCPACAAYDLEVRRQRAALAIILPVVPSLELKGSILGPMLGGGATIAGGGAIIAGGAGAGAGAGGIGLGGAGAAATAGAGAGSAAAGAGGVAGLATSAGSLAGAGAAGGLGALAANTVVAKALTIVAVAAAAAGTGKVAEEVHHQVTRPAHAAPAKTTQAPSVVTSSDPTTTTALPATHTTVTTTTTTPAALATAATTTSTSPSTPTGTTATAPTSSTSPSTSSTTPASGAGASTPAASTPADPGTGGTSAPATSEPAAAACTPAASDPAPSSADPPAATQTAPAANDPGAVSADAAAPLGSGNDPATGTTTAANVNGATPPGCPTATDPSTASVPAAVTTDPAATPPPSDPAATDPTTTDPAANGQCPPVTPAGGSANEPAAGATTTAGVTEATPAP